MSLLALLVALLAQHAWPPPARQPLMAFYGRMCLSAAKRLDAGDRNSGIVAWLALVFGVMVPAALVTALAVAIHPFVVWILDIAVLYGTLRFLWERMKLVVEPTGALATAGVLSGAVDVRGRRVGIVLSGGNVDLKAAAALFA